MTEQSCPICGVEISPSSRYPRYACATCAARAASPDGRLLEFFNLGLSGGYSSRYADTQEPYDSHECWIDGIRCHADEARFGGIVIEVEDEPANAAVGATRGRGMSGGNE